MSATHGIRPLHSHEHLPEGGETPHVIYDLHKAMVAKHNDHRNTPLYENLEYQRENAFNIQERAGNPSKRKQCSVLHIRSS